MTDAMMVLTTTETQDEARRIADALVERRLAACVQISGPITSVYRWEGKVEQSPEWLCRIKTRRACYPQVEEVIGQLHSYDTPQIVAVPIVEGSKAYLTWLNESCKPSANETTKSG